MTEITTGVAVRTLALAALALTLGCETRRGGDMGIDELNAKFGAPGRIVFRQGFAGYPEAVIANRYGAAEIALLGANVLSYRPTGLGETLFRPAKRDYNRGDKFHGGVPVCWPQFGKLFSKDLPAHGFASKMVFEVRGTEYTEEKTEVTLGIRSDADTRSLWPHDFDLEVKVSVSMKLNLSMKTTNTGGEPFGFSCGFHPYLRLRDRDKTVVRGLDGAPFVDGTTPEFREGVQSGDLRLTFAPDHIFTAGDAARHEYAILDDEAGRAIALASRGNGRTVVWNVGDEALPDLAADDWRKFVCVEPVSDWPGGRTLAPGASYTLEMAVQASLKKNEGAL
ncbi:MAG: hypothetical protein IKF72_04970 [Kiritimatiellae bacterium]|nr:hypothetical protein [Kiritimatiellia bacterium]